jgi:hypothetical protein
MQAGMELCNESAVALLFGEAVRLKDVSILGLLEGAFDSVQSMYKDMNRYAALGLDEDVGDSATLLPLSTVRSCLKIGASLSRQGQNENSPAIYRWVTSASKVSVP